MEHRPPLQRILRMYAELQGGLHSMANVVGNVIFIVVALVVIAAAGGLALAVLGTLVGLVGLAIKVGLVIGAIYLVWMVIRRLTQTTA